MIKAWHDRHSRMEPQPGGKVDHSPPPGNRFDGGSSQFLLCLSDEFAVWRKTTSQQASCIVKRMTEYSAVVVPSHNGYTDRLLTPYKCVLHAVWRMNGLVIIDKNVLRICG